MFVASLFLPALYYGFVVMPLNPGKATGPTFRLVLQSGIIAAYALSAAIPAVVIGISKQPLLAKFGQLLFLAVTWAICNSARSYFSALWRCRSMDSKSISPDARQFRADGRQNVRPRRQRDHIPQMTGIHSDSGQE